jgi:superfamily II DNA/RNA helicase
LVALIPDTDSALATAALANPALADGNADATTFESLGLSADLVTALAAGGITSPFPIQALTIPDALAGRDVCGMAQTGSGKTLAFGLPMIERTTTAKRRRPHAVVLVPTRELANQVADELAPLAAARGLWLCAIYGGSSMVRQIRALHAGVDIVIATPGRLNDLLERGELTMEAISFVVLDEADQMADMGFLPQIQRILDQVPEKPQTLLFSATLDGVAGALVRRYQQDPVRLEVVSETSTVDTLKQRFIGVSYDDKLDVAARILAGAERAVVFTRTTHGADRLAAALDTAGRRALPIHGRCNQNQRERTLAQFAAGDASILVATNVAARGLHVNGVDVVMHFDPPEDGKTYLHRSGRTARAGADGIVITLALPDQIRDVVNVQREAGVDYAIVPMRPDDERLDDLGAWEAPAGARLPDTFRGRPNGGGSRPAPRGYRPGPRGGGNGGGGGRPSNNYRR